MFLTTVSVPRPKLTLSNDFSFSVGMPGGAAEDVPVCLVLGTASVTAIEKEVEHITLRNN